MRYEIVWDQDVKLFFVIDTFGAKEQVSTHWTSDEAVKRQDELEHVHGLIYRQAA